MCCNCFLIVLEPLTVYTMLMSNLKCINCLQNMRLSLVQQDLKGFHNHQLIVVRKRAKSFGEQAGSGVVGPPPTSSSSSSAVSELTAYLDSDCVTAYDDDFDLILWWRDHKLTYQILYIMARDIMSVHVSIVSFESCFSLTGRILEERRRHLSPENVEMLTCIKDWELGARRE